MTLYVANIQILWFYSAICAVAIIIILRITNITGDQSSITSSLFFLLLGALHARLFRQMAQILALGFDFLSGKAFLLLKLEPRSLQIAWPSLQARLSIAPPRIYDRFSALAAMAMFSARTWVRVPPVKRFLHSRNRTPTLRFVPCTLII